MADMIIFNAGDGVNVNSLNTNFETAKTDANTNEESLNQIAETALLKDGSNLTQNIIDRFNQSSPNVISAGGNINLADNSENFLTLTADGVISLPAVNSDNFSHTIVLIVDGGDFSLDLGTTNHLMQPVNMETVKTYSVMYIFNKLDNAWYYCLAQ